MNPGAIVNRELTSRVRAVASLASQHKAAVKNDLKLAMQIVKNMDERWRLWQRDEEAEEEEEAKSETTHVAGAGAAEEATNQQQENDMAKLEEQAYSKLTTRSHLIKKSERFNGPNPLLANITDFLVDEVNAEEEELLGKRSFFL